MKTKRKFRPQFRRGRKVNAGHPVYVFNKENETFQYIGLTHSPITQGVRNIKLEQNPNPQEKRDAYIRPKVDVTKEKLQTRFPNWKFSELDKGKVKSIIKKNKKKQ